MIWGKCSQDECLFKDIVGRHIEGSESNCEMLHAMDGGLLAEMVMRSVACLSSSRSW